MVILIKNLVCACDTAAQGALVRDRLDVCLRVQDTFVVDFSGVSNVTSSFVNVAFASLVEDYGVESIKRKMKLVRLNKQVADMIRQRMNAAESRDLAA